MCLQLSVLVLQTAQSTRYDYLPARSSERAKDLCECFNLPEAIENRLGFNTLMLPEQKDFESKILFLMEEFFKTASVMLQKDTTPDQHHWYRSRWAWWRQGQVLGVSPIVNSMLNHC